MNHTTETIATLDANLVPLRRRRHRRTCRVGWRERLGSGSVSGKIILLCEERESAGTARSFGELARTG